MPYLVCLPCLTFLVCLHLPYNALPYLFTLSYLFSLPSLTLQCLTLPVCLLYLFWFTLPCLILICLPCFTLPYSIFVFTLPYPTFGVYLVLPCPTLFVYLALPCLFALPLWYIMQNGGSESGWKSGLSGTGDIPQPVHFAPVTTISSSTPERLFRLLFFNPGFAGSA